MAQGLIDRLSDRFVYYLVDSERSFEPTLSYIALEKVNLLLSLEDANLGLIAQLLKFQVGQKLVDGEPIFTITVLVVTLCNHANHVLCHGLLQLKVVL